MRMTGLVLAVTSLLAIGVHAKADDPKSFYPTAVGTKWVYLRGDDTLVQTVTKVTRHINHTEVVIGEEFDGKVTPSDMLIVDKDGVRRVCAKKGLFPLLQFPFKDKAKWAVNCGAEVGTCQVFGLESVKVPAGKYEAFRVEYGYVQDEHIRHHSTSWYAPGVGLVRQTLDGEKYLDLVLFTPAKTD